MLISKVIRTEEDPCGFSALHMVAMKHELTKSPKGEP